MLGTSALVPIATVSATARTLGDVRAAAARVLTIVDYPAHVDEPTTPNQVRAAVPAVEFDNVRFAYPGQPDDVLRGVSLRIEPGETVALVGRSGAGKTTCAHLLLRFWDTTAGAVRIGRLDATDTEVHGAARVAGAHEFIHALPAGYATPCGERGAVLSGGQRQRIAIARALLTQAPVLLLDEAKSSLDTESERALHEALEATRGTRTTLVIAHRLFTIRRADRVVLLDDGTVIAQGTHDDLITSSADYRRVLARQHSDTITPAS